MDDGPGLPQALLTGVASLISAIVGAVGMALRTSSQLNAQFKERDDQRARDKAEVMEAIAKSRHDLRGEFQGIIGPMDVELTEQGKTIAVLEDRMGGKRHRVAEGD